MIGWLSAGGPSYVDTLGQLWSADTQFTGGVTYATTSSIGNTSNPALYQLNIVAVGGAFAAVDRSFSVPVSNGQITIQFFDGLVDQAMINAIEITR